MSTEFLFRLIGMAVLFVVGIFYGAYLGDALGGSREIYAVVVGFGFQPHNQPSFPAWR